MLNCFYARVRIFLANYILQKILYQKYNICQLITNLIIFLIYYIIKFYIINAILS